MDKTARTPAEKIELMTEVISEMTDTNIFVYSDDMLHFSKNIFLSAVESFIWKLSEKDGLPLGTRQAMKVEFTEKLDALLRTYCDK